MMPAMTDWTVTPDEARLTPFAWLKHRIPAAPDAYLRQLLRGGRLLRLGLPLQAEDRLIAGDVIHLPGSGRLQELIATDPRVVILFEDDELLVAAKPAGLAVHASHGHEEDNLTDRVATLLRDRGARFRSAPIHRLDLDTSGPVLFGKGQQAIGRLGQLMMAGAIHKTYLGLVHGNLPDASLISPVPAKGTIKNAESHVRTIACSGGYCLLEIALVTGRKHQIRRQLADAGTPLLGDRRYGGAILPGLQRLFLHGSTLSIARPGLAPLRITVPLPADLIAALNRLGFPVPEALTG
jgi:23S rRNA-/tRNA-specific pseudouridylate synthase